jgi:hypothetical protein
MNYAILKKCFLLVLMLGLAVVQVQPADAEAGGQEKNQKQLVLTLQNEQVKCTVILEEGKLIADCLEAQHKIKTDADFGVDVQWTGWLAPGKIHNADNPVMFTKKDFRLASMKTPDEAGEVRQVELTFKGVNNPLEVKLIYKLEPGAFYVKRQLAVRDPKLRNHFLRWLWPRRGILYGDVTILKPGGFGRPLALQTANGGAFFGLEYPAAENFLKPAGEGKTKIRTGQEMGIKITDNWIKSEWTVAGLTPDRHVKLWFSRYLDSIRVAPLRPYLLYNTWYDVRSPEYTKRPEDVMNEANLLRIIADFKREMFEKRGLKLDAFVLDDGWDIYKSDWVLRTNEFPNGLKPIVEALKTMGTDLGMWFGPIGGYSYRKWRIEWMKEHGYEAEDDQLCLAGTNYHKLFKKRTTDFVRHDGVAYFKWDGIRFSCSEPDHGHPVGIYSRRAVMEAVKDLCTAVREINPKMYLNITSGTWLSPWWMKYANMIWMQGHDYGYANAPSISKRDAAITYRDVVLYEDYGIHDFWFPISNLMTHGIIKGHLQKLGGEAEPPDKFTDNAILYFARGVSMWELYISPNLLTDGEWDAIGKSIRWARDRFDVLKHTEMIGGNPGNREPYGYAHFYKKRGIAAVRNPSIKPQILKVKLDPAQGLCPRAASLVVERVYPNRWISPRLYAAGAAIELPLQGYETAIYEIYPLETAVEPLLAGVVFDVIEAEGKTYALEIRHVEKGARLLNPEMVREIKINDAVVPLDKLYESALRERPFPEAVKPGTITARGTDINVGFTVEKPITNAALCFLLEPAAQVIKKSKDKKQEKRGSEVIIYINGREVDAEVEQQTDRWAWYKVKLDAVPGQYKARIRIRPFRGNQKWDGKISAWMVYNIEPGTTGIRFHLVRELSKSRPMPPLPRPAGEDKRIVKLVGSRK